MASVPGTSGPISVSIAGLNFSAPTMVAAGPPGRDAEQLGLCAAAGAGGLVAKTISIEGAKVPRPCMARPSAELKDSMINVELWSDYPPEFWYEDKTGQYDILRAKPEMEGVPLIGSLGYTAEEVSVLVPKMDPHVDAFEFSCHYTSLDSIRALASAIRANTKKPVFAKLSPHGHDLLVLARELRACGVDGFVLMNSLGPCLSIDIETQAPVLGGIGGKGWLSGPAVKPIALYWVSVLAREFPDVPIIGVGGVSSWKDVVEFILCGASAVEICTAAIYKGPKVFTEIRDGLLAYCKAKGIENIAQLRGKALANLPAESNLVARVSNCDDSLCIHCGICESHCTYRAISVDKKEKTWKINPEACYGCGLCTTVCPKRALNLVPRK